MLDDAGIACCGGRRLPRRAAHRVRLPRPRGPRRRDADGPPPGPAARRRRASCSPPASSPSQRAAWPRSAPCAPSPARRPRSPSASAARSTCATATAMLEAARGWSTRRSAATRATCPLVVSRCGRSTRSRSTRRWSRARRTLTGGEAADVGAAARRGGGGAGGRADGDGLRAHARRHLALARGGRRRGGPRRRDRRLHGAGHGAGSLKCQPESPKLTPTTAGRFSARPSAVRVSGPSQVPVATVTPNGPSVA